MKAPRSTTGQLMPAKEFFGSTRRVKTEAYDPEGAKKTPAEAGFPMVSPP